MSKFIHILTTLLLGCMLLLPAVTYGAPIDVKITRKTNPLPPNAGELKENFGRYFTVTVVNNSSEPQDYRLELNVQGPNVVGNPSTFPETDDALTVHSTTSLGFGFRIGAGQTLMLSEFDLTTHFKQYMKAAMKRTGQLAHLLDEDARGFGLLPEGHYAVQLQAYSNRIGEGIGTYLGAGHTYFDIAYKAQSPVFTKPTGSFSSTIHEAVIPASAMNLPYLHFEWLAPKLNLASLAGNRQFTYDMQIISIPIGAVSIEDCTGVMFEQRGLVSNFCDVPIMRIRELQDNDNGRGYAVRVRAQSAFAETTNQYYTLVDNDGYSNWMHLTWAKPEQGDDTDEDETNIQVETESTEEIGLTIRPKYSALPIELETYFKQPGSLFDIRFDNSRGPARRVSMLLQYYKDDDGFMVKPSKQHSDRTLTIGAGEARSLTAEEVNYLMGEYEMGVVVDFKAQSGYLGSVTKRTEFPDAPDNVCCRMALADGNRAISSCTVVARAKSQFELSKADMAPEPVTVTVERLSDEAYPREMSAYMDQVEKLFSVKVKNNSMHAREMVLQLAVNDTEHDNISYGYNAQNRYIDRFETCKLRLSALEEHTFTPTELHAAAGGFDCYYHVNAEVSYPSEGTELAGSYQLDAEVYDASGSGLKFDDTYGVYDVTCPAHLSTGSVKFSTDLIGMVLLWQDEEGERPSKLADYFDTPGSTMMLALDNNTGEAMTVFPVLTLLGPDGPDGKPIYTIRGSLKELNERAKGFALRYAHNEGAVLKNETFDKTLGTFDQVTFTGQGAGTYDISAPVLTMGMHRVRVDLYDVSAYDGLSDVTLCKLLKTDYLDANLADLIVTLTAKDDHLPSESKYFFGKPSDSYEVKLKNLSGRKRNVVLQLHLFDQDTTAWSAYGTCKYKSDLAKHLIELPASKDEVALTEEQVNTLLGDYTHMTYETLDAEHNVTATETKPVSGTFLPRGDVRATLYAYDLEKIDHTKRPGEVIGAQGTTTFRIQTISVKLEGKQKPLPAKAEAYFGQKPSDYLTLTMANNTDEELKVYPRLTLRRKDTKTTWRGVGYDKRFDDTHYITLPAKQEVKLSEKQIDALWADFANVQKSVAVSDDDKETKTEVLERSNVTLDPHDYQFILDFWDASALPTDQNTFLDSDTTTMQIDDKGTIKILMKLKDDVKDKMPTEPKEYFDNPGKYFDINLINFDVVDHKVGLDLVYNDTLVATALEATAEARSIVVPGRGEKAKSDTLKLTTEQINALAGGWKMSDVRRIDPKTHKLEEIKDPKLGTGTTKVSAVAFSRNNEADTLGLATLSFFIELGEVTINDFVLHLTKSEKIPSGKGEGGFKGEGYIGYKLLGLDLKMNVEFDSIWIDEDHVVTKGLVKTKERKLDFSPVSWFDVKDEDSAPSADKGEGEKSKEAKGEGDEAKDEKAKAEKAKEECQDAKFNEYYRWACDGARYLADITDITMGNPVTLPLGIDTTDEVMNQMPVAMQMVSAAWTPDKSWMNLMAEYKMPDVAEVKASDPSKNNILVLAAPYLTIHHDDTFMLPEDGMMALISDVTFTDPKSGFEMTCKAPSNYKTLDDLKTAEDGCLITWTNSKFDSLLIDASVVIPKLMKANEKGQLLDASGNVTESQDDAAKPSIELVAGIKSDGNWFGKIKMDPFQIPEAKGFTFVPTGTEDGILYDHSVTYTPTKMVFPEKYNYEHEKIESKWTKANKNPWMGFYWERLKIIFPEWLKTVGSGGKDKNGNDRETTTISVTMEHMMYDPSGFSSQFSINDLINAELDGWGITLEEIKLDIVQNNFNEFGFNGKMTVPFMEDKDGNSGKIDYMARVNRINSGKDEGTVRVQFETVADEAAFKVGFLPVIDMDFAGSYFDLTYASFKNPALHANKKDSLGIQLVLNGRMGLKSTDEAGFDLPDIHFYRMYVANHVVKEFRTERKYADNPLLKWDGPTWHNGGKDESKATLALSAGHWSLASMSKKLGPFEFTLDKFEGTELKPENDHFTAGIDVKGGVNVMDGIGAASAEMILNFELDFEKKISKMKKPTFKGIEVSANFGGAKLGGTLKAISGEEPSDDDNKEGGKLKPTSGYEGSLDLTLPGDLMKFKVEGGYYKAKEIGKEAYVHVGEKVARKDTISFAAGYLEVAASSSSGIPMGPINLTGVDGGFYINCSKGDGTLRIKRGEYGGMVGLRLSDTTGKLVTGGFKLFVFYDTKAKSHLVNVRDADDNIIGQEVKYSGRLSEVRLIGDMHVITEDAAAEKGVIDAKAQILYVHRGNPSPEDDDNDLDLAKEEKEEDIPEEHYFELSLTVEAASATDKSAFGEKIEKLVGKIEESDVTKYALGASGKTLDDLKDDEAKDKDDGTKPKENQVSEKRYSSSTKINLTFHVDFIKKPGEKYYPWYLYMGTPDARCTYTIIDFEIGNKSIGAGAKLGANSYVCIGNKLPEVHDSEGNLHGFPPPLPSKVEEFLNKKAANIDQEKAAKDTRAFAVDPSTSKGGLLLGGELYGDFWCNALICYAKVGFDAGLDFALLKVDGQLCAESLKRPGRNGWYGTGQVYAYMYGELGVMLKFLGKTNEYPIVSLGLGGVLQGGLPNPSWFYGKFKAHGEVFGGLIKFNRTVEVKAGNVCTPVASSPLDDIDIFADCTPGLSDQSDGHSEENAVSPSSGIVFTTNMDLDEPLELMDQNLLAQVTSEKKDNKLAYRTFMFKGVSYEIHKLKKKNGKEVWELVSTNLFKHDAATYKLMSAQDYSYFEEDTKYRVTLKGRAFELINDSWQNPMFLSTETKYYDTNPGKSTSIVTEEVKEGKMYQQTWYDTKTFYFCTGKISPDIKDHVKIACGHVGKELTGQYIFQQEAMNPYLCLDRPMMSSHKGANKKVLARISRPALKYHDKMEVWETPEVDYSKLIPLREVEIEEYNDGTSVRWQHVPGSEKYYDDYYGENNKTYIYGSWYEWDNQMVTYLKTERVKVPFVLQFVEVNLKQTRGKRQKVDPVREHALTIYNQSKSTRLTRKSYIGKTLSREKGLNNTLALNDEMPLDEVPTLDLGNMQDTFEEQMKQELDSQSESYFVENTMEDKNLSEQSEIVLWQGEYKYWRKQDWSQQWNTENRVRVFAQAFEDGEIPQMREMTSLFGSGTSEHDTHKTFDDYRCLLEGVVWKTNQGSYLAETSLSDKSWISKKPNDPFTILAYGGLLTFYNGTVPNHRLINSGFATTNAQAPFKLCITGFPSSYKPIYLSANSDGKINWLSQMASAQTSAGLTTSYATYNFIQKLLPTQWRSVNGSVSGYAHDPANYNTIVSYTSRYLKSMGNMIQEMAKDWTSLDNSFRVAAGLTSESNYSVNNKDDVVKAVRKWGETNKIGNYSWAGGWIGNYSTSGFTTTVEYDRRQIPLAYARLSPYWHFFQDKSNADRTGWFTTEPVTSWTQRIISEAAIWYFKKPQVLMNRYYTNQTFKTWTSQMRVISKDQNWSNNWYNNQQLKIRLFRPNDYNTKNGSYGVRDWNSNCNEKTNVYIKTINVPSNP